MKSIVEQVQDEIRFCKSTYNSCIKTKDCFDISTGKNLFVIKSDYLNDCSSIYHYNIHNRVKDVIKNYGYKNITAYQLKEINTTILEAIYKGI